MERLNRDRGRASMSEGKVRTFFAYVDERFLLVRAHPAVKIVALIVLNVVPWLVEAPVPLAAFLASLLLLATVLRAPLGKLKNYLVYILLVAQAVVLSYALGSKIPGSVAYVKYPWGCYVTEMTFLYMAMVMLRIAGMLVGSTLIFLSLRDVDVVYGLKSLGVPFAAAFVFNLAMRFSALFLDDYAKVRDAMLLKGVRLDVGGPLERAKLLSRTAVPLMVIAVRRMQDLSFALELKGFPPKGKRTYIYTFRWKLADTIALALLIVIVISVVALKVATRLLSFPGWPLV
jgi:energy-coupling factor transporter transmembrane protein EcfT